MRKAFIIFHFSLLVFSFAALTGCRERPIDRPTDAEGRVLLLYDNIGAWFVADVAEAGKAVAAGALAKQNQRVIVYQRGYRASTTAAARNTIYELVKDSNSAGGYKVNILKQYAAGQYNNLLPATINAVVADMRSLAPALHYGLAFGSHGSGWIPKIPEMTLERRAAVASSGESSGASSVGLEALWAPHSENDKTRFLAGYNQEIDVAEFAGALDDWSWDFVLLDDCFMSSIEALWELREVATYVVSSPTEIISYGFPYDRVVSRLFARWESDVEGALINVCQGFVDYYAGQTGADTEPCATVSLVRTNELPALKNAVRALYTDGGFNHNVDPMAARIQFYEGITSPGHVFWDLDQYMDVASTNVALMEGFRAQLARAVVLAGYTDTFYTAFGGRKYSIDHFSGLSTFIHYPAMDTKLKLKVGSGTITLDDTMYDLYKETSWYKAISQ